jgi:hypothetical protein
MYEHHEDDIESEDIKRLRLHARQVMGWAKETADDLIRLTEECRKMLELANDISTRRGREEIADGNGVATRPARGLYGQSH